MAILNNSNAISSGGYDINNSLRFRSSASAYLSRTPGSAGNRKTWTYSIWLKRGTLNTFQCLLGAGASGSARTFILLNAGAASTNDNILLFHYNGATGYGAYTTPVYRDPSAWYHIVVAVDTTQATSTNRIKIYVNGVQQTATGFDGGYPAQNTDFFINNNTLHTISKGSDGSSDYIDGYQAETYFIDGSAKTPSDFGETDTTTGVWKPKAYTGTYGTNGFYLKFSDIATTSGSNAGLGKDFSGNTNYWTTNNISVTAGTTYDAMTDSPTNTSATVANYATLNPVLQNSWWAAVNRGTIQDGNLTFATGAGVSAFSNFDLVGNSGKWYYEMTCSATDTNNAIVIAAQSRSTFEVGYYQNGNKQINSATPAAYGASWTSGDVIGVAIDVPNNNITFYKNNTSQGVINNAFPTGQPVYVGAYYNSSSGSYAFNFGQRPFSYTPPSGYVAMNTFNLSTPTILQGNKYMDATTYTGTGTTQVVVNQGQFKPDFAWLKIRSASSNHVLINSIAGVNAYLNSNTTGAEQTSSDQFTSFNSNGFTLGANTTGGNTNANGSTYVGWQWQAGQGSTSSNTSGSITSTVSVSTTAGFSIVTYTGNGTNGATVGHGLGVAPRVIILKSRSIIENWAGYFAVLGNGFTLNLNSTAAASGTSDWNSTTPTSTVFTLGNGSGINQNTTTYVAYCWAEIAGFSKFGSFTANNSSDGNFIYLGFRPRWIMCKQTSGAGGAWFVLDTARNTFNVMNNILDANSSGAERNDNIWDATANGMKLRIALSGDFIYAAFAENPFKNSLAR